MAEGGARKAHFVSFYFLSHHAACWILFSNQRLNMPCWWSLNQKLDCQEVPKKGTLWMGALFSLHYLHLLESL